MQCMELVDRTDGRTEDRDATGKSPASASPPPPGRPARHMHANGRTCAIWILDQPNQLYTLRRPPRRSCSVRSVLAGRWTIAPTTSPQLAADSSAWVKAWRALSCPPCGRGPRRPTCLPGRATATAATAACCCPLGAGWLHPQPRTTGRRGA
jgi:hypothetical protein